MSYQVHIEFRRVQSYLFAVPKLKDMIGANVLLGEAIRIELPRLAIKGLEPHPEAESMPELSSEDPLTQAITQRPSSDSVEDIPLTDDPKQLFRLGIEAREGGHFIALFKEFSQAEAFKEAANLYLRQSLPELDFTLHTDDEEHGHLSQPQSIADLPAFQVCEESGNGPASSQYASQDRSHWISRASKARKTANGQFRAGKTRDIIGLMRPSLPAYCSSFNEPEDLKDLCGGGYLAVIHADGNSIGKRQSQYEQSTLNHGEGFYFSLRLAVRRALVESLARTFCDCVGKVQTTPYQLLMLGGDDLLLVCRAALALPWVVRYAHALESLKLEDGSPLTFGAGVAIAAPNFPFHRLVNLAEDLAGSAKRLYRAHQASLASDEEEHPETKGISVVDWMVCTNSWSEDLIAIRRQDALLRLSVGGQEEQLALSGRPYPVLQQDSDPGLASLEGLLMAAEGFGQTDSEQKKAARSQWRQLPGELRQGKRAGEQGYQAFLRQQSEAVKNTLKEYRLGDSPWTDCGSQRWLSRLPDMVEIMEIPRLAQAAGRRDGERASYD